MTGVTSDVVTPVNVFRWYALARSASARCFRLHREGAQRRQTDEAGLSTLGMPPDCLEFRAFGRWMRLLTTIASQPGVPPHACGTMGNTAGVAEEPLTT